LKPLSPSLSHSSASRTNRSKSGVILKLKPRMPTKVPQAQTRFLLSLWIGLNRRN